MSERILTSRSKRILQVLVGLSLLMLMAGFILILTFNQPDQEVRESERFLTYILGLGTVLTAIAYSVLGLLIVSRHSRHVVGWIFLITGIIASISTFSYGLADLFGESAGLVYELGYWIGELAFIPTFTLPITLGLQYFPSGRLPSRRWRPLPILTILAILGMTFARALHPWPWLEQGIIDVNNPMAIDRGERFFELLVSLSNIVIIPCLIGSLATVLIRFRRSKGVERIQMKWLAYSAMIGILSIMFIEASLAIAPMLNIEMPESARSISGIILFLMPALLSVAIAVAILRHRLFDIDIIIRKTLQYAFLTGILVLVYLGLVVILQTIFSATGGQQPPIFIVISTLVIAALFNPLRRRIQEVIDSRFYRKKYESEQALTQFASAARNEVDLDQLSAALLDVVQETTQPEYLSLWLTSSDLERNQ